MSIPRLFFQLTVTSVTSLPTSVPDPLGLEILIPLVNVSGRLLFAAPSALTVKSLGLPSPIPYLVSSPSMVSRTVLSIPSMLPSLHLIRALTNSYSKALPLFCAPRLPDDPSPNLILNGCCTFDCSNIWDSVREPLIARTILIAVFLCRWVPRDTLSRLTRYRVKAGDNRSVLS